MGDAAPPLPVPEATSRARNVADGLLTVVVDALDVVQCGPARDSEAALRAIVETLREVRCGYVHTPCGACGEDIREDGNCGCDGVVHPVYRCAAAVRLAAFEDFQRAFDRWRKTPRGRKAQAWARVVRARRCLLSARTADARVVARVAQQALRPVYVRLLGLLRDAQATARDGDVVVGLAAAELLLRPLARTPAEADAEQAARARGERRIERGGAQIAVTAWLVSRAPEGSHGSA